MGDSAPMRNMECKALEATKSFRCDQAENGSVAVEMVRRQLAAAAAAAESLPQTLPYDLILIDYQLQIMDGPSAISDIRNLGYYGGAILGLTDNVLQDDIDHMVTCVADAVRRG